MNQHNSTLASKAMQANRKTRPHNRKHPRKRIGCDISNKHQSLLTEGLPEQRERLNTYNLGPTLPTGQIRKRKRDAFAAPGAIVDKLAEPGLTKRRKQTPSIAVAPVHAFGTNSDQRKPMLNNEINIHGPADLRNRILSDRIRTLARKAGQIAPFSSHNRKTSSSWHWPPPALPETKATTSLQDLLQNDQNKRTASFSSSTESKKKETEYTPANDSDNKWPMRIPGQIWNTTTTLLANAVDHLPFYTSPKEKQWQEATRMWQEEATKKCMTVPSILRIQERRETPLSYRTSYLSCATINKPRKR
ncbi:hypothetical protein QBC32DRAFT_370948 [Pseudoneurospora amorphoporcata]|uniref:Uncharacterized protein n=1 Tax=Pseudoneurospora amorphoporcata TaxID=241081 RepID=A0AAN6NXF5_9PEZI|nr:hypothetical protein QBC32DRAFT_370948 [Pseudoneurospora amorphoporcata]